MKRRPLIGVTGPDRGGLMAWLMTALALLRCGARPRRITPSRPCDASILDGLVIGGGTDVDPFHYGEERLEDYGEPDERSSLLDWLVSLLLMLPRALFASHSVQDYDPDRDRLERHMIEHALYHHLPLMGICRGAQLMNVVLGGSLHQKIEHFYTEETGNVRSVLPSKAIEISASSLLRQVLDTARCNVNALHDQSIKDLGDDVLVSAREHSGVVQAIERHSHRFFVGVQWHPEYMPQSKTQLRLFQHLVDNARIQAGSNADSAKSVAG